MCLTREQPQIRQTRNIQMGKYKFEKVQFLGTELNNQNNNHEEINKRILAGNRCLHALSACAQSYFQRNYR